MTRNFGWSKNVLIDPIENESYELTQRDIYVELADLNREAEGLAAKLQENFEELGI